MNTTEFLYGHKDNLFFRLSHAAGRFQPVTLPVLLKGVFCVEWQSQWLLNLSTASL